jgi:hypothetical protein
MNTILQFLSDTNATGSYRHYKAAILSEEEALLQQQPSAILIQQVIYSNVKDIVEQEKYVFESFGIKQYQQQKNVESVRLNKGL